MKSGNLRKMMDRLNQNSHYGIMIDTEITKMIHDYIGSISCDYDRLNCPKPPIYIGPVKVKSLKERLNEAYYQKEEEMMKATSVQNIKNVKDIVISAAAFPMGGPGETLTIVIYTDDDVFEFNFEGPDLVQKCKKTGLFSGWEKDQKIRELEKELKISKDRANRLDKENNCLRENYMKVAKGEDIKEKNRKINDLYHQLHQVKRDKERLADRYKYLKTMNEEYSERINVLQRMYNLERSANEAQHKFFRQYAGKGTEIEFNYAIGDTDETSYVIVDKEEYQFLKDHSCNVMLHGMDFTPDQLVDRILELEKLKTPTIENFEEPSNNVNHPSHYTGKYECIDVMQDVFGNEATDNFCLCNAFKYIWRANKKNGLEDVKKAVWYLTRYIEEAEKDGVSKGE